jgi:hypothetical protein
VLTACDNCAELFEAVRETQRWCSKRCSNTFHNAQRTSDQRRTPETERPKRERRPKVQDDGVLIITRAPRRELGLPLAYVQANGHSKYIYRSRERPTFWWNDRGRYEGVALAETGSPKKAIRLRKTRTRPAPKGLAGWQQKLEKERRHEQRIREDPGGQDPGSGDA